MPDIFAPSPVNSVNGQTGDVELTNSDVGAAASSHSHAASDITSGTVATARLGSGTADNTTFLRGDNTWATPSGSGGSVDSASNVGTPPEPINSASVFKQKTGTDLEFHKISGDNSTGILVTQDGDSDTVIIGIEATQVAPNISHNDIQDVGTNTHDQIDSHIANTSNPHSVTKAQVGLGNVDNTSDANKPVSTATQTALDGKAATTLSNLASVAINTSLVSDTDSTDNLGSSSVYWANTYTDRLYLNSTAYIDGGTAGKIDLSGNQTTSGYLRVGSSSAPNNTTAGDLTATRLSLGNGFFGAAGRFARITGTDTETAPGSNVAVGVTNTIAPTSNSAAEYRAIYFQNLVTAGTGIAFTAGAGMQGGYFENRLRNDGLVTMLKGVTVTAISADSSSTATVQATTAKGIDLLFWNRPSGTTTATVDTAVAYDAINAMNSTGMTATNFYQLRLGNPSAGNTITNLLGIDIPSLTRGGTLNVGIRIDTPSGATSNYALQLSGTGGGANSGITFGTDTTLYRSAADTLKTDDSLVVTGTLEVGTVRTYSESNVTTDRTYDANATTLEELADVVGTLIADLRTIGLVN